MQKITQTGLLTTALFATTALVSSYACTSPTGSEGEQVYNVDYKVMQYCDGTNWVAMAADGFAAASTDDVDWQTLAGATPTSIADSIYTNGNVGIGTNLPATALHINDAGFASMMLGENTAGANHHITHEPTDNTFRIYTGAFGVGTPRLTINQSGNVGIGTTAPAHKLDIDGAGLGTVGSPVASAEFNNAGDNVFFGHSNKTFSASLGALSGNGAPYIQSYAYQGTANSSNYTGAGGRAPAKIQFDSSTLGNSLSFQVSPAPASVDDPITWSTAMVINDTGNVGIGTTAPDSKFFIYDGALPGGTPATSGTADPNQVMAVSGGVASLDTGFLANGTSWMQGRKVDDNATNYNLLINPNGGNVGIGTTTPSSKLNVVDGPAALTFSNEATSAVQRISSPAAIAALKLQGGTTIYGLDGATTHFRIYDETSGYAAFYYDSSSNNVGIGTATPGSKFSVFGLNSGTGGVAAGHGAAVGALCIDAAGDIFIDTDGVCS